MRMLWLANPLARRREIYLRGKRLGNGAGGGAAERPGGEPSPPLASAASRRVGPCTRSVVRRSCTGGPGAASASVTRGRRADSERSGPSPPPPNEVHSGDCFGPAGLAMTAWRKRVCWRRFNLLGGPSWTRTTDLTLIRGALSPPELRAHTVNGKLYGEYSRASG